MNGRYLRWAAVAGLAVAIVPLAPTLASAAYRNAGAIYLLRDLAGSEVSLFDPTVEPPATGPSARRAMTMLNRSQELSPGSVATARQLSLGAAALGSVPSCPSCADVARADSLTGAIQAAAMYRAGDTDAAIQTWKEAGATPLLVNLAVNALQNQRPEDGLTIANLATTVDPTDSSAWTEVGLALEDLQQPNEALAAYEQAARTGELPAPICDRMARLLLSRGRAQDALPIINRALALHEEYSPYLWTRADVLFALGDVTGSDAAYADLQARNPDDGLWPARRGRQLAQAGRKAEGLALAELGVKISPDNSSTWVLLGLISWFEMHDPARAIGAFEQVITMEPDHQIAYRVLGQAYECQGRQADAANRYRTALNLDASDQLSREGLLRIERGIRACP